MTPKEFLENLDFHNETMPINRVGIDDANWTDEQVLWLLNKYTALNKSSIIDGIIYCTCGWALKQKLK